MSSDGPYEKQSCDAAKQGATDHADHSEQRPMGNPIASNHHSNNQSEKWWKQPEHLIQVVILIFVGSYTVLTFCLLLTGRDTEHQQLRAYVMPTQASVTIDNVSNIKANVIIKNFGQSPAYHVRHWACVAVRDFVVKENTVVDPTDLQDWWGEMSALPSSYLPPGDIIHIIEVDFCDDKKLSFRPLTPDEKTGILASSKAIYLYGGITYDDIFGFPHSTRYRRFTNGKFGLSETTTSGAKEGNEAN